MNRSLLRLLLPLDLAVAGHSIITKPPTLKPLFHTRLCEMSRDRDAREVGAAEKRTKPNARNAGRDRDAREIVAVPKRLIPNARNAIADRHAREIGAAGKRTRPNTLYAGRNRHAREIFAVAKRLIPNTRNAVRNRHAREIVAAEKRMPSNARNAIRDHNACNTSIRDTGNCFAVIAEFQFLFGSGFFQGFRFGFFFHRMIDLTAGGHANAPLQTLGNHNAREIGAIPKRIIPNARNAVRDRHAREIGATIKRTIPNARDAIADRHACEIGAVGKRAILNTRDAVRDRDAREVFAAGKRSIPNARNAGRNRITSGKAAGNINQFFFFFIDQHASFTNRKDWISG